MTWQTINYVPVYSSEKIIVNQNNCPSRDQIKRNDHNVNAKNVRIFHSAVVQTLFSFSWKRKIWIIFQGFWPVCYPPNLFCHFPVAKKDERNKKPLVLNCIFTKCICSIFQLFCTYCLTQSDLTLFYLIFTYFWGRSFWTFRHYGSMWHYIIFLAYG